jgi:hypothetical protein
LLEHRFVLRREKDSHQIARTNETMSVSTEVQRTLVKSPPELWAELSSPDALARHLAELGKIRITSLEPETKVEWEAEEASGFVQLKQSGWGTKVTLSVTRNPTIAEQPPAPKPEPATVGGAKPEQAIVAGPELKPIPTVESAPAPAVPEPAPAVPEPAPAEPEPAAAEPEPVVEPQSEPVAEPEAVTPREPQGTPSPAESQSQLGFFARLFRKRKRKPAAATEPEPEVVAPAEPELEIEVVALAAPELVYPDPPAPPAASEPAEDLASELESLEEQMAAETTELLTGVLDRLGAAHHRPFSRG